MVYALLWLSLTPLAMVLFSRPRTRWGYRTKLFTLTGGSVGWVIAIVRAITGA